MRTKFRNCIKTSKGTFLDRPVPEVKVTYSPIYVWYAEITWTDIRLVATPHMMSIIF